MNAPTYCLCQDCLAIYEYSDDRHNGDEVCIWCDGDLCGCKNCDSQAAVAIRAGAQSGFPIGNEAKR